jgi:hypothetical protein
MLPEIENCKMKNVNFREGSLYFEIGNSNFAFCIEA